MPTEFEGLSAEEAVQRARIVLGVEAPIRCWKTRRGGVLGFFSQEIFVAGVAEPSGSHATSLDDRALTSKARELLAEGPMPELDSLPNPLRSLMADLVESTHDELTVDRVLMSPAAFSDVLARAEAALVDRDVPADHAVDVVSQDAVPEGSHPVRSRHLERLRATLVALGVPSAYRPTDAALNLDGVWSSLDTLPTSVVPTDAGSLIMVVGARRDAERAAQRLIEDLGLADTDLISFEDTATCRQRITRRRSSGKVSVLIDEAPCRAQELDVIAARVEMLRPDFVLGAVPATLKRADVQHWCAQVGRVDALSLSRWNDTASPAELMGLLPITYVDGLRASTIRWTLLILEAMEAREP